MLHIFLSSSAAVWQTFYTAEESICGADLVTQIINCAIMDVTANVTDESASPPM